MEIDRAFELHQAAAEKEKAALALLNKAELKLMDLTYALKMRISVLDARHTLAQARSEAAFMRYRLAAKAMRQEPDLHISAISNL